MAIGVLTRGSGDAPESGAACLMKCDSGVFTDVKTIVRGPTGVRALPIGGLRPDNSSESAHSCNTSPGNFQISRERGANFLSGRSCLVLIGARPSREGDL